MANEQNLIPAKKGEVRNPNGKPKGTVHIKTLAKRIFDDMQTWNYLPDDKAKLGELREKIGSDKTYGQALIYSWLQNSLKDPRFATIVLELMDGKGKIEHSVDPDLFDLKEFTIKVVKGDSTDIDVERETGNSPEPVE